MFCDKLEVWDGVGGGFKRERTYAYLWLIYFVVWQKAAQDCKAIILQLKKKLLFKTKKTHKLQDWNLNFMLFS